jgi:hypothetical protein
MKDVLDLIQGLSQKAEEGGSVTEEGDATASATSADADKDAASSDSEGKAGKGEDKNVNTSSGGDKNDDSKEDDNDSDAPPKKKAKTVKVAMLLRFWRPTQQPMPQLPPPPNPMLNSYALPTSASLFKAGNAITLTHSLFQRCISRFGADLNPFHEMFSIQLQEMTKHARAVQCPP